MTTNVSYYPARGGVNLAAPPWALDPGELLLGFNYEVVGDGYRRMDGYERFDGQTAPSEGADSTEIEANRALIEKVPGEGPVRGVWVYNDDVYAFRDNVGQTACLMYKATASGWTTVTTPALSPGGSYEFMNHNFYGTTTTYRMYGVDGINKGFMFDGTTFTQVTTGMTTDAPKHLAAHANRLVYAFAQGSLQFSPLGEPAGTWTLELGAAEIGVGQEITAIRNLTGNVLGVWCEKKIDIVRGTDPSSDMTVENHSIDVGAIEGSVAILNRAYFLDRRGLTTLEATDAFGDFDRATFSEKIEPLISSIAGKNIFALPVREKNQYRLMFVDPNVTETPGVICTLGNEQIEGFTSFSYPFSVTCVCNSDITGEERIFAGGSDGFVYEIDSGTNHDGAAIDAYLRFPFNALKSPRSRKRFRKLVFEIDAGDEFTVYLKESFDYNDSESPPSIQREETTQGSGGYWGIDNWNQFVWGGPVVSVFEVKISGTGKNLSAYLYTSLMYERPYTIHGVAVQYDIRRLER